MHLLVFIQGEWHLRTVHVLFGHLTAAFGLYLLHQYVQSSSTGSLIPVVHLAMAYLSSLFLSICRNSTNFLVMQKMHEQYGDLVRTGPNEISIFRPDGIELLDGYKSTNERDVWYDILHPRKALVFARKFGEMRELRASWSQAVSSKSVNEYSTRVIRLSDDLIECILSYRNEPVKLNDVMSWFSFDAMGEIAFSESFGMLENRQTKVELAHQRQALALLAPLNDATWIAHLGFSLFPYPGTVRAWWASVRFCCEIMEKRMASQSNKTDMANISAVVAGSDTTRASLIGIWYFLCKHPEHANKIYSEVQNIDVNDVHKLASLPHLNAVIKELLRLAPPAMTGSPRLTGPNGLWVGDRWIPAGVKVTAPKFVAHHLSSAFVHPTDFIPERWTTRPELVLDIRAYAPFSTGPHQCIGKSISFLEMRVVTTKIIQRFHVSFSHISGHKPEAFWADMKDQVTMMPGDTYCCFAQRSLP
ncbi:cytochrome P450 [Polyplosphaeria fusca]|uniref:Cytochrome P450 n=1 Tax=Polyplosphaeria fusca TaxID=682080 RepID=A0A9P4QK97_9PLEO|nr:cytochrome P450 [Polyplosphaeria fusca]